MQALQPEALDYVAGLRGPVAVVAAIGQYRSGKSFLLNQLMRLNCSEGFQDTFVDSPHRDTIRGSGTLKHRQFTKNRGSRPLS